MEKKERRIKKKRKKKNKERGTWEAPIQKQEKRAQTGKKGGNLFSAK